MKTKHISRRLRAFAKANEAVSALEYAILVGVVVVGIGAALAAFETQISNALGTIGAQVGGTTVTGSSTVADN